MRTFVVVVMLALGCVQPGAVTCPDGRTCPDNTVCHPTMPLCVLESDEPPCEDKVDGDKCGEGTDEPGICEVGYCISGCGDGVADDGEECDDGNFRSHDGCSSSCSVEQRSWVEWKSEWVGRTYHTLAYHAARNELIVTGGGNDVRAFDDQWTRNSSRQWTRSTTPLGTRQQAMVAYDSTRNKLVLFGGSGITATASGDLNDTWEYDGTWTQVFPATSPPARRAGQMAYDVARQRIVLFSGRAGTGPSHIPDLWEYDGTNWTQITNALVVGSLTPPGARAHGSLAYDAERLRMVLFGGQAFGTYTDLWEYDGTTWTKLALPVTGPAPRFGASLAFSPTRKKVVLFGGIAVAGAAADTWEYDGTWAPVISTVVPPARAYASFAFDVQHNALVLVAGQSANGGLHTDAWELTTAGWNEASPRTFPSARQIRSTYDAARGQIVLYGGYDGRSNKTLDDTWVFDGVRWSEPVPPTPDLRRHSHQLTYDAVRERVVMFGGARVNAPNPPGPPGDTVEWDGSAWTTITPTTVPPKRGYSVMADTTGSGVLMFGGLVLPGGASNLNDTWEWDGTNWNEVATPAELAAQYGGAAAYDPVNDRTVLLGIDGATWVYANRTWTQLVSTADGPGARIYASMVYDAWLGRVVMFGGTSPNGLEDYADLWELVGDTWQKVTLFGLQPAVRNRAGFAALPAFRSLVMFGGVGFDDTWFLKYVSDADKEEMCGNGEDDDDDRQIDDADPDCS